LDVSEDPDFLMLMGRARAAALGAFAHQDVPFERLVEELAPQRDPARSPLFQVLLVLQNVGGGELRAADLAFQPLDLAGTTAKFDLSLSLTESRDGLLGVLEYSRDLFEAATMTRLAVQ